MRSVDEQLQVLRAFGLDVPAEAPAPAGDGLVVVHPTLASAHDLAGLITHGGKPGFVVPDLTDLAEFVPIEQVEIPDAPVYLAADPQRGDEMADWSPDEALPAILASGRSPMTVHEGLSWLLQEPTVLRRNHCFMTIASRKPQGAGLDRRTPAIWISNGVERDGGAARKDAPKVGWCWAGNRHTWLGFGSVASRS